MVIAIVFAHAWGVIQAIVLGSFARTIRVRTAFAAMAVGLYACAPLATLLELSWTRLAAPLMGVAVFQVVRTASYTLDPFLEEILKVLPLTLLLTIPVIKRQWSLTDYVLIAAATGAGFGLAEDLYRYSASADRAQAIASGWAVALTRTYALIPGIRETLTSWLPAGVAGADDVSRVNAHLVWSAMVGLAVGLTVLKRTTAARATAALLFLCVALDHAAGNATNIASTWLALLATPLGVLARWRGVMGIAALAAAWWLDRDRQGTSDSREPLLAAEQSASPRMRGTLEAAVARFPWSTLSVDRFVRMRRAYNMERASAPAEPDALHAVIVHERDRVDRELATLQSQAPSLLPSGWTQSAVWTALRQPAVILWLVIMAPPVLWFVVGGWPQTARLQAIMIGPIVWKVVFPISVLAQVWIAWRVLVGMRTWLQARGLSSGDDAAVMSLHLACGVGAVALGGFSLLRSIGGLSPGASLLSSLHAVDAANRLTPGGGSMLADGGAAFAPPPPTLDLPDSANALASAPPADPSSRRAAPEPTKAQAPARAPKPTPPTEAAQARARAAAAAADALDAQQRKQRATNALDAADIARATADADADPAVAAARARARQAHDAADAADIASANEFADPWGEKGGKKAAAGEARRDSRSADADQRTAEQDFARRFDDAVDAAKATEQRAKEDVYAADRKAEATKNAAEKKSAAGATADDAAAAYAAAQRRAEEAFFNTAEGHSKAYSDALEKARLAKERADAAKAHKP